MKKNFLLCSVKISKYNACCLLHHVLYFFIFVFALRGYRCISSVRNGRILVKSHKITLK